MMTSTQIRQSFLDFFTSKQHTIVPSSSLLPDSPNLLFTNAGMNQFVPIFLNDTRCPYVPGRAADTQKCIRAGGKHNDLDDVGLDTYHHTFFEMLGNWSFGDYFKAEAIDWAWELVVKVWKFPPHRLYATVYNPDKSKGDPSEFDQEAWNYWAGKFRSVGLNPNVHIVNGNKKDNFWMMGDTGPCGPCSELHVDLTPEHRTPELEQRGATLVNQGDARCIEIWNLVFIQFNAEPGNKFSPLPAKHVDTGMGFERVTSIIQGTQNFTDFANAKISNYETDIFRPIFDELEKMSGKKYGSTLPQAAGSTGDSPVPSGYQPDGTTATPRSQTDAASPRDAHPHSAGLVAQRDGPVARATQVAPGATYSKRHLPHFEKPWAIYHVTINTIGPRQLSPAARDVVFDCVLHWRESRYRLVAACVMPDHAHFIIQPGVEEEDKDGNPIFWPLSDLLHSIKSYSAKEVNKLDNVKGTLWQQERYDRYMRSDADLQEKFHYVCRNPWAAGVVKEDEPWPWLWTPEIEAWKPYVPLSARGSTGDSPVPLGDPPSGTGSVPAMPSRPDSPTDASRHSAGLVAQRDGPVARATHPSPATTASAEQVQLDIAFRVIADHIRTLSFAIADGIQPGNTDRNYVLRRILRRAVRYGRTLGFHEPFFYKLVDVLARTMGDIFPEIRTKQQHVKDVLKLEEESFNKTLDSGIEVFELALRRRAELLDVCAKIEPKIDSLTKLFSEMDKGPIDDFLPKAKADVDFIAKEIPRLDHNDFWLIFGRQGIRLKGLGEMLADAYAPDFQKKEENEAKFYVHGILTNLKLDLETSKAISIGITGRTAFTLYDTYGFPLDLTELMARERGMTVDVAGFNALMEEQKARARAAQKKTVIELSQIETKTPTRFLGYDALETPARVLEVVALKDKTAVVLDTSTCYAEMGGQLGDTGVIEFGSHVWRVVNTQKNGNTWLHFIDAGGSLSDELVIANLKAGNSPTTYDTKRGMDFFPIIGDEIELTVDRARRDAIQRHHTVTHLLHWALHEVASKEASQKGSFVGPDKLTFDFNSAPLTPAQVADIEKLVNERILENAGVSWTEVPHADVKGRPDVMQFFGDKYGDTVRVVQIGGRAQHLDGYSMELCGGTHTRATGEIGLFRIVSENAIASGVRRIEAVAGLTAFDAMRLDRELIRTVAGKVSSPLHELEKKIEAVLAHQKELEKALKTSIARNAAQTAAWLLTRVTEVNGIPLITQGFPDGDADYLQAVVDAVKSHFKGVIVVGGAPGGSVTLIAAVTPDFTAKVQAGKIIQQIAPIVGGKGGGKPDNARGGGKDATKLDEALAKVKGLLG